MTKLDPEPKNGIDLPTDIARLGVDADGAIHEYSRIHDTVYVREPGAQVWLAFALDGLDIGVEDWLDHTERVRGDWTELRYNRDGFAGMIERVTEEVA